MVFSILLLVLGMTSIPLVNATGIWIVFITGGILRSGVVASANTLIFEIKGVGETYGGIAIGLKNTLGMLGAFVSSPIGNSLTVFNADLPTFLDSFSGDSIASVSSEEINPVMEGAIPHQTE